MSVPRFDYSISDDGEIEILIGGRDKLTLDGKHIDLFTQKEFRIESKEIIPLIQLFRNIAFAWCKKFKCNLDEKECH